ncbi:MAG: M23 family metallopeptidase [Anaerolineae bacterium]|nr:M23 family metallopeptidase [Anaerolineae bacterium]
MLCRFATHLSVIALWAIALGSGLLPAFREHRALGADTATVTALGAARQSSARGVGGFLVRAAVPRTGTTDSNAQALAAPAEPPPPADAGSTPEESSPAPVGELAATYVVQPGDTVLGLAERFGVTPETILSANSSLAGNPDLLRLGQEILIPSVSGVLHVVAPGDTLKGIAQRYQADVQKIIDYRPNGLVEPYILHPGQKIMVVGGVWTAPETSSVSSPAETGATGSFMWPCTGRISQGSWSRHVAIDIAAPTGTPIFAADSGTVTESGWTDVGYGQYVIIDHGNGFRTLYAHMSKRLVSKGAKVQRGQRIGLVGSTGNSTGPHLHFEIYRNGVLQNPLKYLP